MIKINYDELQRGDYFVFCSITSVKTDLFLKVENGYIRIPNKTYELPHIWEARETDNQPVYLLERAEVIERMIFPKFSMKLVRE